MNSSLRQLDQALQIFISYKREDAIFARQLYNYLLTIGYSVWLDIISIIPGANWDTEIHNGLRNSQIVIGIMTKESLISDNVLDEWGYALSTGKRLFLIWLRDVDEAAIPPRYIRIQRIDMRQNEVYGLEQLRLALKSSAKIVPETLTPENLVVSGGGKSQISSLRGAFSEDVLLSTISYQKTNRIRMLEKVKIFWIDGVLEQSLHGVAMLELGIQPRVDAVENPWETVLQHIAYGDYRLPAGTNISDIYHDLNGELLILGDPGSGKTTTLLELARDRIAIAEQDESAPIPVILNLSSWADTRKSLYQWLVDELNTKYAVPRKVAKTWLDNDALLLMLDGLDEVLLRYRNACVAAINNYRTEHGFTSIIVCSRLVDYEALTTRLYLNGAVVLQSLEGEQIDVYLNALGSEMQGVREVMTTDLALRKLADTPLMLSIMTLAFRGLPAEDLPRLSSIEAQRRRLFETYTRRMFMRRPPRIMTHKRVMHYLTWLAGRMVERKQSVFYIENLQVDWIAGDFPKRLYRLVGRTMFGAIGGAAIGLISGIAFILLAWLLGETQVQGNPSIGTIIAVVFGFIAIPAAIGALVFATSGLQAYAMETIPGKIRPIETMIGRVFSVIGMGITLGLFSNLVFGIGLFVVTSLAGFLKFEYFWAYRGESFSGWSALAYNVSLSLFLSVMLGIGAGVATTIVAIALKLSSRRIMINLLFLSIYGFILGVLLYSIDIIYSVYASYNINNKNIIVYAGSVFITCVFLGLIGNFAPRRSSVTPFVFLSIGLTSSLLIGALLSNIANGITQNINFSGVVAVGIMFISAIVLGLFVGRINDHIESAEALRWRWSRRWSVIGLISTVVLGVILLATSNLISYYNGYSEDQEQEVLAEIIGIEPLLNLINTAVTTNENDWKELSSQISNFDILAPLVQEQVSIEGKLAYRYKWSSDNEWAKNFYLTIAPTLDCYHQNFSPFGHSNSFPNLSNGEVDLLSYRYYEINNLIKQYSLIDIEGVKNVYNNIYYCNLEAQSYRSAIRIQRQQFTKDGLKEWAVSILRVTLVIGIPFIFGSGVIGGLRKTETIDIRTYPNSGIRRTVQTALRITIAFGFVGAIIGGVIGVLLVMLPEGDIDFSVDITNVLIPLTIVFGVSIGVGLGLILGGSDAVVKHVVLRLFLQHKGNIPRNYAALLDEAADKILLRKVGGGYIFIHRYLLEYYASLEGKSDEIFDKF